jgi:hypothetical protein
LYSAFDSKKTAYIPSGTYNHTGLVFPTKSGETDAFTPTIKGEDKSSVILNHIGAGVGVKVVPRTGEASINGVKISDMTLVGNSNTTIGLELSQGYYIDVSDVSVTGASQSCIEMPSVWLSNFKSIYCRPSSSSGSGFVMTGGNCQHNTIDAIFVQSPKNVGMRIRGGTTFVGNLACDNAEGEYAYYIEGFKGIITALGCENPATNTVVRFNMSQCIVGEMGFLKYVPPDNFSGGAISASSSHVLINEFKTFLGGDQTETLTGALFNLYYSDIQINQIEGQQGFTELIKDTLQNNYATLTINDRSSACVSIRKRHCRPYIGTDKAGIDKVGASDALIDKSMFGNAIFLDCTGGARYKSDGTDCSANNPVHEGDWFIESNPSKYNVAGYVIRKDCTELTAVNSEERPIALILHGATTNRPTFPFAGMEYFDSTLNKPIWFNGTSWVDAYGTTV